MVSIALRVKSIWIEYLKSIRHEPGDASILSARDRHFVGSNVGDNTHGKIVNAARSAALPIHRASPGPDESL